MNIKLKARFRRSVSLASLGIALFAGGVAPAQAQDTLSVALFSDESQALWPVELQLEIVHLNPHQSSDVESVEISAERVIAMDGELINFRHQIRTSQAECSFELKVVARHHANQEMEIEYDLQAREARYQPMGWSDYLLHRLNLNARLELGPNRLSVARADIVTGTAKTHTEIITVGGEDFELRLFARSLRG